MHDELGGDIEDAGDEIVLVLGHSRGGQDAMPRGRQRSGDVVALDRLGSRADEIDELGAVVLRMGEESDDVGAEERQHTQHASGRGRRAGSHHADAPGPGRSVVVPALRVDGGE